MTSVEEYMRLGRRAQKVVRKLLIRGVLPSPNSLKCFDCGVSAEVWEHRDYRLPDEVEPVCRRCNHARGRALPNIYEPNAIQTGRV